jgi:CRISPR-associated endonuclease/helicase Cas3
LDILKGTLLPNKIKIISQTAKRAKDNKNNAKVASKHRCCRLGRVCSMNAAYFKYWGKAKKPLEIDYSEGQMSDEAIVEKYDSLQSVEQLQQLVTKHRWRKINPGHTFSRYHLLAYHSLDVAAVGQLVLEQNLFSTDAAIARLTDDKTAFIAFFTQLLALHDIGKFATAFQSLKQFDSDSLIQNDETYLYQPRHDSLGYVLWLEALEMDYLDTFPNAEFGDPEDNLEAFIKLVTGHHGKPPSSTYNSNAISLSRRFSADDIEAAKQFLQDCQFLQPNALPTFLLNEDNISLIKSLSWLFAGVTILADWMGSDQDVFNYVTQPISLIDYWQKHALPKAQKKLTKDGYGQSVAVANFDRIDTLFPFIKQPTPLQAHCATCPIDNGPQLFLLEDITGAGKTEAALILAQRLLSQTNSHPKPQEAGIYVALPTMATSNAMFERMEAVYRRFFTGDKAPSLVLAHGARHLSKRFTEMVQLSRQPHDQRYEADEQSATGWCNFWFVDNRKKSLLADVGVGTVDQALLAVLPAQHQSLRLLGLSRKILIIDEIHSYATYEGRLIQALIKFHASLGGTTILLSATMPYTLRRNLVKAYTDGIGMQAPAISTNAKFPWVTQLGLNHGLSEEPVESRAVVSRTVQINYQTNEAQLWQLIESSLAAGKSVCWIKNTVNETIECFDTAQTKLAGVAKGITLFHSRFCMNDRIITETKVLKIFGKHSTASQRQGQLLISSPILDQSLDVDISIMVSDVAPMDVLIQRLGRCCRHLRFADENTIKNPTHESEDGRGKPALYLHGPEFNDEPDKDWLGDFSSGTQAIYQDTARTWLTVKTLLEEKAITMPSRARFLMEAVYGPNVIELTPTVLQDIHDKVSGEMASESFLAKFNQLDVDQGYSISSNNQGWCDESKIPTRLADETVDFVLLIANENALTFYAPTERHPVDMNKISVRKTTLAECDPAILTDHKVQVEALSEQHSLLQYCSLLILTELPDGSFCSAGLNDRQQAVTITYDRLKGLQVSRA